MSNEEDTGQSEIDQIVEQGLRALEKEQYDLAAEIFRRVVQRAPFRHDARSYLALALDGQFGREGGSATAKRPSTIAVTSSMAAASGHLRATRLRFPIWLLITSIALTCLVIATVSIFVSYVRQHGIQQWVERISKPRTPPVNPAQEQLAADLKKADAIVMREQYDEALDLLHKRREAAAALNNPPDLKGVDEKIAEVYAAKAGAFYAKANHDKALETAQEGLKSNDSSIPLNYLIGRCYVSKAMQSLSNNDTVQGRQYCEKAAEALEKVVAADPNHLPALELLGKTYSKFNVIKAIEVWRRIVSRAPDSPEGKNAKNYLQFHQIQ